MAIIGGVLVIAGACLPWVDIHNTVENTIELRIERGMQGIYALVLGILVVAGISPNPARKFPEATGDVYPCPQCMQLIKSEWEVCPYCGVILANVAE